MSYQIRKGEAEVGSRSKICIPPSRGPLVRDRQPKSWLHLPSALDHSLSDPYSPWCPNHTIAPAFATSISGSVGQSMTGVGWSTSFDLNLTGHLNDSHDSESCQTTLTPNESDCNWRSSRSTQSEPSKVMSRASCHWGPRVSRSSVASSSYQRRRGRSSRFGRNNMECLSCNPDLSKLTSI